LIKVTMHLSPHDCDLLAAEAVPPERASELRAHAKECAPCDARLRDAEASRAAFLVENPAPARAHALLEELGRTPRPLRQWLWAVLGGATTLAAALVVAGALVGTRPEARLKGAPLECRLVRLNPFGFAGRDVVALVRPGELAPDATAEDALRCTAAPGDDGLRHLEVWGADRVTPPARLFAGELAAPGEVPPGSAFSLSGHGEMRLYFVWSRAPLDERLLATALAPVPDRPVIAGARVEWLGVVAR
jgi:hypothetical protein